MVVSAPDITFQLLDGPQAAAHADELQVLHAEVYADPPYGRTDDAAVFADRFQVQRRQPGFVLAEARHGGYLVGYASGMPLRPSTSWWRNLTAPLPADVTTEHPGRTFALVDLLVRASWRRQGIARTRHDLTWRTGPRNARRSPSCPRRPRRRTPWPSGAGARSPAPAFPARLPHCRRTGDRATGESLVLTASRAEDAGGGLAPRGADASGSFPRGCAGWRETTPSGSVGGGAAPPWPDVWQLSRSRRKLAIPSARKGSTCPGSWISTKTSGMPADAIAQIADDTRHERADEFDVGGLSTTTPEG